MTLDTATEARAATQAAYDQKVQDKLAQELDGMETRLQKVEQVLDSTVAERKQAENTNENYKFTIKSTSSITSASVTYIALSAISAPAAVAIGMSLGTAYLTYLGISYLCRAR